MADFGQQMQAHIKRYQRRVRAIAKESIQKSVQIASTVRGEGGRMRVKTGFLWHSVAANIGSMPSGESSGSSDQEYVFTGADVVATLIRWDLTKDFYVGWIANYARPREHFDGFVKGATERWQETVTAAAVRAKRRI